MIILKNQVKELFEAVGVPELTVGRNSNGYLQIVGKECGQPIMTISQVEAPKRMSAAVRSIVIEDYLKPALDKYSKDFIHMVALKKKAKACQDLVDKEAEVLLKQGITNASKSGFTVTASDNNTYTCTTPATGKPEFYVFYHVNTSLLLELVDLVEKAEKKLDKIIKLQEDLSKAAKDAKEAFDKVKITCGW